MTKILTHRTGTDNAPPTGLAPGELSVEMGTPTRLWVGVPTAIDPTGKKLLIDKSAAAAGVVISDTPPPAPYPGLMWWETDSAVLFIWYDDGSSQQWVQVNASTSVDITGLVLKSGDTMTGPLVLPADPALPMEAATKQYVDNKIVAGFGANHALNGDMSVAQRGVTFTNPGNGAYTLDRWLMTYDGNIGTATVTQQLVGAGELDGFRYCINWAQTVAGASTAIRALGTKLEDITRFAGKTIMVSFWAKSAAPTPITVAVTRIYGTGGSPSAPDTIPPVNNSFSLTATWQQFQMPVSVGSIVGKTLGTTPYTSSLLFLFGFPLSSTFGVSITGFKVEDGATVTPFIVPHPSDEMNRCRRYYERTDNAAGAQTLFNMGWGTHPLLNWIFSTPKRATPTVSFFGGWTPFNTTSSWAFNIAKTQACCYQASNVSGAQVYLHNNANGGLYAEAELP